MKKFNPELRQLIRWARASEIRSTDVAPYGFADRVSARWRAECMDAEPWWWAQLQWTTVWVSVVLVAASIGLWAIHQAGPALAYEVFPVYQIAARSLAP